MAMAARQQRRQRLALWRRAGVAATIWLWWGHCGGGNSGIIMVVAEAALLATAEAAVSADATALVRRYRRR